MSEKNDKVAVLVVEPLVEWQKKIEVFLKTRNITYDLCEFGKDAQLKIYRQKYRVIVVDSQVINSTSFELVRYIKMNLPGAKIIFSVDKKERLDELGIETSDLKKMGVSQVLFKPYNADQLVALLEKDVLVAASAPLSGETKPEKEVMASDEEFTRVDASTFVSGSVAVFDLHVRIKNNHYIKIVHKGDMFDRDRVKHYVEKGATHFYFRTKDRFLYVSAMNDVITKIAASPKVSGVIKEGIIRGASEKYIEELFTRGLKPEVIEEGQKLCRGVSEMLFKEQKLRELMMLFEKYSDSIYGHSYLVMFYSAVIGRSLNWSNVGTIENLGMGAMLHDIGKMKLPKSIVTKSANLLTTNEFNEYEKHTELGVEMVGAGGNIPSAVIQIISQHHETIDGLGFPAHLTGPKIFPMAKVVGLADRFVNIMSKDKNNPLEAMKKFLKNSELVHKFDGQILRSFVKSFIDPEKLERFE